MEKYGKVPKKFTKEWWEWFWTYYKIHTCAAVIVGAAVAITVYQAKTKIDYDLYISYIGTHTTADGQSDAIKASFAEVVPDVNENGKSEVQFTVITDLTDETSASLGGKVAEYTAATETKKTVELQMGDSFVFIISKNQMDRWYEHGLAEDAFVKSEEWLTAQNAEKPEGEANEYFVKLCKNNPLSNAGFAEDEELYVAVREIREDEDGEKAEKIQKAAFSAADYAVGII